MRPRAWNRIKQSDANPIVRSTLQGAGEDAPAEDWMEAPDGLVRSYYISACARLLHPTSTPPLNLYTSGLLSHSQHCPPQANEGRRTGTKGYHRAAVGNPLGRPLKEPTQLRESQSWMGGPHLLAEKLLAPRKPTPHDHRLAQLSKAALREPRVSCRTGACSSPRETCQPRYNSLNQRSFLT